MGARDGRIFVVTRGNRTRSAGLESQHYICNLPGCILKLEIVLVSMKPHPGKCNHKGNFLLYKCSIQNMVSTQTPSLEQYFQTPLDDLYTERGNVVLVNVRNTNVVEESRPYR